MWGEFPLSDVGCGCKFSRKKGQLQLPCGLLSKLLAAGRPFLRIQRKASFKAWLTSGCWIHGNVQCVDGSLLWYHIHPPLGECSELLPFYDVFYSYIDFWKLVKNIELGKVEDIISVDSAGMLQDNQVEPQSRRPWIQLLHWPHVQQAKLARICTLPSPSTLIWLLRACPGNGMPTL